VICRDSSIRWRVLEPTAGSPSERRSATANPSLSSSFISFGWKFRIKLRPLWVRLEGDSHCCQPTESRPHLPHDIDPGLCIIGITAQADAVTILHDGANARPMIFEVDNPTFVADVIPLLNQL
jgi:hypothetical protein